MPRGIRVYLTYDYYFIVFISCQIDITNITATVFIFFFPLFPPATEKPRNPSGRPTISYSSLLGLLSISTSV